LTFLLLNIGFGTRSGKHVSPSHRMFQSAAHDQKAV